MRSILVVLSIVASFLIVGCHSPAPTSTAAGNKCTWSTPDAQIFSQGSAEPMTTMQPDAIMTNTGRIAVPYLSSNGVNVKIWDGKTWTDNAVLANSDYSSYQGAGYLAELDGSYYLFRSGELAGTMNPAVYVYPELAQGKGFGVPQQINVGEEVSLSKPTSDDLFGKIAIAATATNSNAAYFIEKSSTSKWNVSQIVGLNPQPQNVLAVGYAPDGTAWMVYTVTNTMNPPIGIAIYLARRTGTAWNTTKTLLPSVQLYNPVAVASREDGQPRIALLWEETSGNYQSPTASVHTLIYDLSSNTSSPDTVIASGIQTHSSTNYEIYPSFTFTPDGTAGIYSIYDKELGTLLLGSLQGTSFTQPMPFDAASVAQESPAIFFNPCGQVMMMYSESDAGVTGPYPQTLVPLDASNYDPTAATK